MTEKMPPFPYKNALRQENVVPFVRKKTADGTFLYSLPEESDCDWVHAPLAADSDGCPENIHWSDRAAYADALKVSETDEKPFAERFRILLPSGETHWIFGTSTPVKKKNGEIVWTGFWFDVSSLHQQDYYNGIVLDSIPEGVVVFDKQGMILTATKRFCDIVHCSEDTIRSCSILSLLPESVADTMQQQLLLSSIKDRAIFTDILQKDDYPPIHVEIELVPEDAAFICVFRDITEFVRRERDLRYLAYHDTNTGIENQAYLKDIFPKVEENSKVGQTLIGVLSIEPKSLGQIRAIVNRSVRFQLISAIADRIRSALRDSDVLAQTGACHFTVLLTDIEFSIGIERKVDRILKAFDDPICVDDLEFDLSVCIGVCFYPQDGKILSQLIERADLALHKARETSVGMRLYNSEFLTAQVINHTIRKNLKTAIENHDIKAFFQPQIDIKTGQIVGMEALARWQTSDGIFIQPKDFISDAEEYGLIDHLTKEILDQACFWNQKWYSMGLCRAPVSVNISARQFHNETRLLHMIDEALDESGLPPYLLELELTESSAMCDPENAQKIITKLLDNNIRCSLDDFGTGYSSLAVLRSFPLKKLKIDRSFILNMKDKKNLEIVRATIAMSHALNLSVLAEGVETRENFNILKTLECDIIQGYLFSQPLCPEDTELLLMRWDAGQVAEENFD